MVDWNVVTGEIITAVLKILLPVCVALILKWAFEVWKKIQGERPDLAVVLECGARTAVFAAEQLFGKGHGEEKKEFAIESVKRYLKERGFYIDVDVITDAIEATVYESMNRWKKPEILEPDQPETIAEPVEGGSAADDSEQEPQQ